MEPAINNAQVLIVVKVKRNAGKHAIKDDIKYFEKSLICAI